MYHCTMYLSPLLLNNFGNGEFPGIQTKTYLRFFILDPLEQEANRNTIQQNIGNNIMVILMIVLMVLCSIVYLHSGLGQQVVLAIRKRIFTPTLYAPQYWTYIIYTKYYN